MDMRADTAHEFVHLRFPKNLEIQFQFGFTKALPNTMKLFGAAQPAAPWDHSVKAFVRGRRDREFVPSTKCTSMAKLPSRAA